jgi:solute carrier family 13 (sodium-dependent dicarboxylate transporter), member 2/3/5
MAKEKDLSERSLGRSILYFLLTLAVAVSLTWLVRGPGFPDSQASVLFFLFFAIALWVTDLIPPFSVSLLIIAYLVFALGNKHINSAPENIEKYAHTFSSSIIWLLLGGFFLASAMTKTKLDESLFQFTIRISGNSPKKLLLGLMATTMVASMIMSNTATTAVVIAAITPLLNSMGRQSGVAKALLLGVPVAATTGGMATIIGSPPNAIAAGILDTAGIQVDFLEWMIYGTPLALCLTALGYVALVTVYLRGAQPIPLDFLTGGKETISGKLLLQRRFVALIMIITVLLWLTSTLHGLTVASISAVPIVFLTLTGIIQGKDIRSLPWDTLILVAGGLSLGIALQSTGLLDHYALKLTMLDINDLWYFALLAYCTMVFSNIMSHTATSTVLIPLGIALLASQKAEITLIIALASSTALFLPVSTPPNAIAFSTGYLEQKDFRLGGILIGLAGPGLIILWVMLAASRML